MNLPSRPSSLRTKQPPGCRNSPIILSGSFKSLSITVTFLPSLESTAANAEPSTPDPMMITSGSLWEGIDAVAPIKLVSEIMAPFLHCLKEKELHIHICYPQIIQQIYWSVFLSFLRQKPRSWTLLSQMSFFFFLFWGHTWRYLGILAVLLAQHVVQGIHI